MLSKYIGLLSLVVAFAATSPTPADSKALQAREYSKGKYINPKNPKLSVDEQCTYVNEKNLYFYWNVVINNAKEFTDDTCGSGFLDNINHPGCTATGWECHYADDGKTMNAGFKTPTLCSEGDVTGAVKKAFGGKNVKCWNYDSLQ